MFRRYTFNLTVPIMVMSGTLLVGAIGTGWYVHRLQQEASTFLSRAVASMRAAEEMEIRTREMRTRLNQILVTGDPQYLSEIPEMHHEIENWLTSAESHLHTPSEQQVTRRIRDGLRDFIDKYNSVMNLHRSGTTVEQLKPEVANLIDDHITGGVLVHAHSFLDINQQAIQETISVNQQAADRVGLGMAMLGLLGAAAGSIFGSSFVRQFNESLVKLTVPVHDAAGKLNEVVGPIELSSTTSNMEELNTALEAVAAKVNAVVTQLQQSQKETLRAEQLAAVGQLAAGMAHELRNPLTAIKMIVQSAVEGRSKEGIHGRALDVIYEQILRQEKSITSFLDFARPARLEPLEFDLCAELQASNLLLSEQAERQGIDLHTHCVSTPIRVLGDAVQIRQVIVNLIRNAIDALPDGGQIRADISRCSADELRQNTPLRPESSSQETTVWALLKIADSGAGLPADLGERIFEPFTSTKETGMGLGLSICKRIVELHGGQIAANNGPTGGAIFFVGLPVS